MSGFLSSLAQTLLGLNGWPVYVVVTALAFFESAAFIGMVLPGETAMVVAGVLAARGNISLPVMLSLAVLAAVGGDQVGYLIGHRFGPHLRGSRLGRRVGAGRWDRAEAAVTRHGGWAVVGGRWVGVLRALVPTVAGATGMPYRRFLLANAAGGSTWALVAVLLGYFAGGSVRNAQDLLGRTSSIGAVVLAVIVGVMLLNRHRGRSLAPDTGGPGRHRRASEGISHGFHLTTAAAVAGAGVLAAAALVDGIRESGDLAAYDPGVTANVIGARNPLLTGAARALTFLGSTPSLALLALVLVVWLGVRRRAWKSAGAVAATMLGSAALTLLLKAVVARQRPSTGLVLGQPDASYAFPSGHAFNTTVFFGVVAALTLTQVASSAAARWATITCWGAVSLGVGASRIYLGYHWMTDVLGGWALGCTYLAVVAMVVLGWQMRISHGRRQPAVGSLLA